MCNQGTHTLGFCSFLLVVPSLCMWDVDDALLGECIECTCRSERDIIWITLHLSECVLCLVERV